MKKFILAILPLLLVSITALAQLEKGNLLLGGGLGISSQSSLAEGPVPSEIRYSNFYFNPMAGYFFQNKWVVGLNFPISYQVENSSSTPIGGNDIQEQLKRSYFGVGPFVRKYFTINEKMAFFAQGQASFGKSVTDWIMDRDYTDRDARYESKSINLVGTLGLVVFPKDWFSINLMVNPLIYNYQIRNEDRSGNIYEIKDSGFEFGFNSNLIGLGANFFLSKK